jgi:hypothetical protein
MAKNKRPKWLESETPELLDVLKGILGQEEIEEKEMSKAQKIVDELIGRLPQEEGNISVGEAIQRAADAVSVSLNKIQEAYQNEMSATLEESDSGEDEDTKEEEEQEQEEKKGKKGPSKASDKKSSKKSSKKVEEEEEEEEEEEDEDEDGEDYSDWSTKDLKKECRDRGIKVTKSMGKSDLVKALEADDQE